MTKKLQHFIVEREREISLCKNSYIKLLRFGFKPFNKVRKRTTDNTRKITQFLRLRSNEQENQTDLGEDKVQRT